MMSVVSLMFVVSTERLMFEDDDRRLNVSRVLILERENMYFVILINIFELYRHTSECLRLRCVLASRVLIHER
ncbi:hypothetical protein LINPERHAP1_LOCUS3813, partial [Linum perenne]